jgi:hypothetical protein
MSTIYRFNVALASFSYSISSKYFFWSSYM